MHRARIAAFVGLLLAVAAGLVLVGCGGGSGAAKPVPSDDRPLAGRCGPPKSPSQPLSFQASDGTHLDGAAVGTGQIGVVFVHEFPGPAAGPFCGWWPFAAWLARHGVRSLLVNLRCFGDSECPSGDRVADPTSDVRGAVSAVTALGAKRVVLIGASLGGVVVVKAAAEIRPEVAGVVDLSGELDLGTLLGGRATLDAGAAAPNVSSPALLAVARGATRRSAT